MSKVVDSHWHQNGTQSLCRTLTLWKQVTVPIKEQSKLKHFINCADWRSQIMT